MAQAEPTLIVGARVGTTAARSMEHVSAFVGRYLRDYYGSCEFGVFPEGTLSRRGDQWYEVKFVPRLSRMVPVKIDPPEPGEIITDKAQL